MEVKMEKISLLDCFCSTLFSVLDSLLQINENPVSVLGLD